MAKFSKQYGAGRADIMLLESFAHEFGLTVSQISIARRTVVLRGPIRQMALAFRVRLAHYRGPDGSEFRGRSGHIYVPKELGGKITGVFGLDNRPVASAKFKVGKSGDGHFAVQAQGISYNPTDIASFYAYPKGSGAGQGIGLIELGGGYETADLATYFSGLGVNQPVVTAISVDGGTNDPTTPDSADGEVMLDIEVAGAVAPAAAINVYFAPNTDRGFLDAISSAIHDTSHPNSVISISWGGPEQNWTAQSITSFNEDIQSAGVLGITVCVAAGDSGASDGVQDGKAHVDFPASSPYALACGGTRLVTSKGTIQSETVWNDAADSATGGGISDLFPVPSYQSGIALPPSLGSSGKPGRGVPDVAGDADPETGYNVRVDGTDLVIGGTSAVAPLMAGLIARINSLNGKNAGFIHPAIYRGPGALRDIISGNNDNLPNGTGYQAGPGWDACTGLGVPNGVKLQALLGKS